MKAMSLLRSKSLRGLSHRRPSCEAWPERGFAYLMALFMILAVVVASQVAVQSLLTSGRREREEDMIWRGKQYTRAIRLYYRKAGHYPKDLEDLQKGLPELHFLRSAAYKDPMSTTDGEWGFIYVNPAGQIIGSSRYASLQQMALMDLNGGKLPTTAIQGAVPASSLASPAPDTGAGSSAAAGANPTSPSAPGSFSQAAPGASPGSNLSQNSFAAASLFAAAGGAGTLAQKAHGTGRRPCAGCLSNWRSKQVAPGIGEGLQWRKEVQRVGVHMEPARGPGPCDATGAGATGSRAGTVRPARRRHRQLFRARARAGFRLAHRQRSGGHSCGATAAVHSLMGRYSTRLLATQSSR